MYGNVKIHCLELLLLLLLLWRDCGFATKWPVSRKMEYRYSGRDLYKKLVASGEHFCKTCAADVLVGAGMQSRAEMYTREEAIKNKHIELRSKTMGPDLGNSFARPWEFGAWPCIIKCWHTHIYSRFPLRAFSHNCS